jgi:hypothetical protein
MEMARTKPRMTYEQYLEAKRCFKVRSETPSLYQLSKEWGIHPSNISLALRRGIKQYDQRLKNET